MTKTLFCLLAVSLAVVGCSQKSAAVRAARPPVLSAKTKPIRQTVNAIDAGDGDYEARVLRAKLEANPADLNARLDLARHYQRAGYPEIAVEHGRLAAERAPESVDAQLALAQILREARRPAEAAAALKKFASSHETVTRVWAWIGLLEDEAGDWKAGELAHRRAVALEPNRDDLHNNLGYCLLRQGRNDDAATEFRAALQLNARSVIARNNLGMALADEPKEAVLNLQSVTDPASAHSNLAVALIEAGKYADARREIDLALSYDRENSAALSNLRLVSGLDGKAAEVPPVVRRETKLARVRAAWRHLWQTAPAEGPNRKESGSSIASR